MPAPIARTALPAAGRIVVLNGCSSAGKSSLAKALVALMPQPHLHLQLDAFRDMEPPGYWDEHERPHWPLRLAALCRSMHAAARESAAHGLHVILDTAYTPDAWHYLVEDFHDQQVWLIGVQCAADELVRREQARGDRPIGLAVKQLPWMHRDLVYDVEVDTSIMSTAACATALAQRLAEPTPARGFAALQARTSGRSA